MGVVVPLTQKIESSDPFQEARVDLEDLISKLKSKETMSMRVEDVEALVQGGGRELLRQLLQSHLDARSEAEVRREIRAVDELNRTECRTTSRALETEFGRVNVSRKSYSSPGVTSIHPLDAELNLPDEIYSFEVRRRAAEEASQRSFEGTVDALNRSGICVPKRQVSELAVRAAQDFDGFYESQKSEPSSPASLLALTFDGKGIIVRKGSLRDEAGKREGKRPDRHRLDKSANSAPDEKEGKRRRAQVAAVYDVEAFIRTPEEMLADLMRSRDRKRPKRPRAKNKRVWASITSRPLNVIYDGFAEAKRRDQNHTRTWLGLVDGEEDQIDTVKRCARAFGGTFILILDIIKAVQYLWTAALCLFEKESKELDTWITAGILRILQGGVSDVITAIEWEISSQTCIDDAADSAASKDKYKKARVCIGYFENHLDMMQYGEYLAAGYPIGTGVIEGACRHLIKDRMEVTGARWHLESAEAVLRLRALRSSGDFDAYWKFHTEQEYQRNHASKYLPGATPGPKATLRVLEGGGQSSRQPSK
jgi:hypothetical protein